MDFFPTISTDKSYLGVSKGDIVCIIMPNMPQAIVLLYAANLIGAPVSKIHLLSSATEVKSFIDQLPKTKVGKIDYKVLLNQTN